MFGDTPSTQMYNTHARCHLLCQLVQYAFGCSRMVAVEVVTVLTAVFTYTAKHTHQSWTPEHEQPSWRESSLL